MNHGVGIAALAVISRPRLGDGRILRPTPWRHRVPVCRYRAAVARTRPLNGAEELEPLALRTLHRSRHRSTILEPSEE